MPLYPRRQPSPFAPPPPPPLFVSSLGVCTFDVGYSSTAPCASSITYIDGGRGVLRYRGVDVADLAMQGDWEDAAYLVLHG